IPYAEGVNHWVRVCGPPIGLPVISGLSDMSEFNEALLLKPGENGRPLSIVVIPLNCQPPTSPSVHREALERYRWFLPNGSVRVCASVNTCARLKSEGP